MGNSQPVPPPIHLLPNELLVKIIEKLPRTQWPALELIDHKFRDAVLLAWGSVREVDIDRDFIYSASKAIKNESDHGCETVKGRVRLQIAQKTEAILKKLYERSPRITSLIGLSLITDDPAVNTTAMQYLAGFEHLETIKFSTKHLRGRIVNGHDFRFLCGIPLISFIEFIETTRSRGTLNEINIEQCDIPNDPVMAANFDQRLRAAFANDSNDPTRQLLQSESISMRFIGARPLTFFDTIDGSKLTKLSLAFTAIDPAVLTNLINGAQRLRHLDFAFLHSCRNTTACQGGRLQQPNKDLLAALESKHQLTSLGFNSVWNGYGTCACHRFEAEFKTMLRTIAPRLMKFTFNPVSLPPALRMGEIRDIIQRHMPQLKSIKLDQCCAEDPEELRGIADSKELEEIVFAPFRRNANNDDYKARLNEVMSTILSKSPRLQRFIGGINYYPDQRVVVELCKLTDLVDLRIRADRLTKEHFIAFSQVFAEKLQVLHLVRIKEGAESGLIELVKKAPQLRELVVERNVTDKLLECLAESCPKLEKFFTLFDDGITFNGVQMLVDRCTKMRWLWVENVVQTFGSSLKSLKLDRYRKLELELDNILNS